MPHTEMPKPTHLGVWTAALIVVLFPPAFLVAIAVGCVITYYENKLHNITVQHWLDSQKSSESDQNTLEDVL